MFSMRRNTSVSRLSPSDLDMNTRRSKPIVRHPGGPKGRPKTYGAFNYGVRDPKMAQTIGMIITFWPAVEERMIGFLRILLGGHTDIPARMLYRTIISAEIKITLMRKLLEETELNRDKDASYDAIIREFKSLNDLRNKYAHSLFKTREGDNKVLIFESQTDDWYSFNDERELRLPELTDCLKRMETLWNDVLGHVGRFDVAKQQTSQRNLGDFTAPN